jgi:integrase
VRFLADSERAALLAACETSTWPALHGLVLLAISTGARRGEVLSLKWADVDLDGRVPRAIVRVSKNGDPRVLLPLIGKALGALRVLKGQAGPSSSFVFAGKGPDLPFRYFDGPRFPIPRPAPYLRLLPGRSGCQPARDRGRPGAPRHGHGEALQPLNRGTQDAPARENGQGARHLGWHSCWRVLHRQLCKEK